MINKIKNFFNKYFIELPKLIFLFIKNFKKEFPIIFMVILFSSFGLKFVRRMYNLNRIIIFIINLLIKFAVSIYINYNIITKKCKDNSNLNNIIKKTLIDAIIVLGSVILSELFLSNIPVAGILFTFIRLIPFVGEPFVITSIFLFESFIYNYTVEKPNDYCTNTNSNSDLKKIYEKYKDFIITKGPIMAWVFGVSFFKKFVRSSIKSKLSPRNLFNNDDDDDDDYEE